ncbi:ferritin-like superfamily [Pavlovales sp. CCMP2436]|nr:ferritin-like superfamily [Pavlovales sp. CCMP2436]
MAPTEPILSRSNQRLILFPIKHADIWKFYKKQMACIWTNEEVDYSQDVVDWNTKMNSDERHFISHILAFFASSDAIVMENISVNSAAEVAYPEARMAYAAQQFFEAIHAEGYGLIIDTLISNSMYPGLIRLCIPER